MENNQFLTPEVKKSFAFKIAAYIMPAIIIGLITVLLIIPAPKPKEGALEGRIIGSTTTQTLLIEQLDGQVTSILVEVAPSNTYRTNLLPGRYRISLRGDTKSLQLPREITISQNSTTVLDIEVQ